MKFMNTRLESEGAEFLVLGNLLIEGIPAYKTYTNMKGFDIIATNPEHITSARIQVKSRWRTKAEGFLINSFECDFVVVALLNRGSKDGKAPILNPQYYIFPVEFAMSFPRTEVWGKVSLNKIPDLSTYLNKWNLIRDFLRQSNKHDKNSHL